MNNFIIQKLLFPNKKICDITQLFYRSTIARFDYLEQAIIANAPAHIDLHTYFNIIPIEHYNEFLEFSDLKISAIFEGKAEFLIYQNKIGFSEPIELSSVILDSTGEEEKEIFSNLRGLTGYLYIVINTHTDHFKLHDIFVSCSSSRSVASVGIVCCTFRREADLLRIIETIQEAYEKDEDTFAKSNFYVIDNDGGKTLEIQETKFLKHIKNQNVGGSGGFTRGIIQSKNDNKSHVLLIDDDILLFGEVIRRTIILLSLMKNRNMGVHGSMLELEHKSLLHEAGEYFDLEKRLHVNMHYGKIMTSLHDLKMIQFEALGNTRAANMFGWWFTAFPMEIFEKIGLPLPLFVSGDDLEFSLRAYDNGYRAFIAPVISVWHPSHMTQHAPLRIFFITRNRLAYSPAHTSYKRINELIKIAIKEAKHFALTKRYATADSMCVAIEEYLRGVVWYNENLADWLPKLRWLNREKVQNLYVDEWHTPVTPIYSLSKRESLVNRMLRKITFNGHLFSSFFHREAKNASSIYHKSLPWGVLPISDNVSRVAFRSSSMLYYDDREKKGYCVKHNNYMFWRVYLRILKLELTLLFGSKSVYKQYKTQFKFYTSYEFWKGKLGI